MSAPSNDRVLIVDDDPTNLHVLRETLRDGDYKLIVATGGEAAISLAKKHNPVLILLDVMMPGMDGFEVCAALKADPETADAAVIFLTALDGTQDKVRGLTLGAVDYVSKPFQPEEVIARVTTHLTVQRLQRKLALANEELEQANSRMKHDLEAAARVQHAHLPERVQRFGPATFEWRYQPTDELAGDLLNVFSLDERHVGFYVLDVSGHGVPAALLSVSVSHSLLPNSNHSTIVTATDASNGEQRIVSPAEVLNRLNEAFPPGTGAGLLFTIVYGIVDLETGILTYGSAGHPGPIVSHPDGTVEMLESTGIPIGVFEGFDFEQAQVSLQSGTRVFLFSDGLYEEHNAEREMFGLQRLLDLFRDSHNAEMASALDGAIDAVTGWSDSGTLDDDAAVLGLELKDT